MVCNARKTNKNFIILEVIVVNENNRLKTLKIIYLFTPEYEKEFWKFPSLNSLWQKISSAVISVLFLDKPISKTNIMTEIARVCSLVIKNSVQVVGNFLNKCSEGHSREKLTVSQLEQTVCAFYRKEGFITAFKRACQFRRLVWHMQQLLKQRSHVILSDTVPLIPFTNFPVQSLRGWSEKFSA